MARKHHRWTAGRTAAAILRPRALLGAAMLTGCALAGAILTTGQARADAPSFVTAALGAERAALVGVMQRRGAVDLDAVDGRVMPRSSGAGSLANLDLADRNTLASLQRVDAVPGSLRLARRQPGSPRVAIEIAAAARAITTAWEAETARFPVTVLHLAPPPMPTGLRARFRPGEDRAALTAPRDVAAGMLAQVLAASEAQA